MYDVQFAASTYREGHHVNDLDAAVGHYAEAGYAGVEVDARSISDEGGVTLLRDLCYKHQIAPISAVVSQAMDDRPDLDDIGRRVDYLDRLGAEYLILTLTPEALTESRPLGDTLTQAAGQCAALGMRCSLELSPHLGSFREISNHLREGEDLTLSLRFTAASMSARDSLDTLKRWGSRCNYLVLEEGAGYGESILQDLEAVLEEIGFAGWVVVRPAISDVPPRPDLLRRLKSILKT